MVTRSPDSGPREPSAPRQAPGRDPPGPGQELAVRRLTFDSASAFGIYDRGLLQPGMAADIVVFDADTVKPIAEDVVHDFPNDGWRMRELAEGVHFTVVNGEVLMEKGTHTGSLPGRVIKNARHQFA